MQPAQKSAEQQVTSEASSNSWSHSEQHKCAGGFARTSTSPPPPPPPPALPRAASMRSHMAERGATATSFPSSPLPSRPGTYTTLCSPSFLFAKAWFKGVSEVSAANK